LLSNNSWAYSVGSGEVLEVSFHLPYSADPMLLIHPTDTVVASFGTGGAGTPTIAHAALYDGESLLGINSNAFGSIGGFAFYFYWTATGSNFTTPAATLIDGASLLSRTISGKVRVSFNDTFTFSDADLSIAAGNGRGTGLFIEGGTLPVVDSVQVATLSPVPEPTGPMLYLGGLAVLALARRVLKRDHAPQVPA